MPSSIPISHPLLACHVEFPIRFNGKREFLFDIRVRFQCIYNWLNDVFLFSNFSRIMPLKMGTWLPQQSACGRFLSVAMSTANVDLSLILESDFSM